MAWKGFQASGLEKAGWKRGDGDQVLINPCFGEIVHVVRLNDKGEPIHDQLFYNEPLTVAIIPINGHGEIGLIEIDRPTFSSGTHHFPIRSEDYENIGTTSLELPRGFAKPGESPAQAATREGSEEIGLPIVSVKEIGLYTPNTSSQPHQIPVFMGEVDDTFKGEIPGDADEKILKRSFLHPRVVVEKMAAKEIYCGFTLAVLGIWLAGCALDNGLFD